MKQIDSDNAEKPNRFVPVSAAESLHKRSKILGELMVEVFHLLALFSIGAVTVWAAAYAFWEMTHKGHATVEDLLLLFIYLEIGAMVGIYFKTNRMPVRFLIYVAITALTRHMISFVNITHDSGTMPSTDYGVLIMAGAILLLASALLLLRYGSHAFPSDNPVADSNKSSNPDF